MRLLSFNYKITCKRHYIDPCVAECDMLPKYRYKRNGFRHLFIIQGVREKTRLWISNSIQYDRKAAETGNCWHWKPYINWYITFKQELFFYTTAGVGHLVPEQYASGGVAEEVAFLIESYWVEKFRVNVFGQFLKLSPMTIKQDYNY